MRPMETRTQRESKVKAGMTKNRSAAQWYLVGGQKKMSCGGNSEEVVERRERVRITGCGRDEGTGIRVWGSQQLRAGWLAFLTGMSAESRPKQGCSRIVKLHTKA